MRGEDKLKALLDMADVRIVYYVTMAKIYNRLAWLSLFVVIISWIVAVLIGLNNTVICAIIGSILLMSFPYLDMATKHSTLGREWLSLRDDISNTLACKSHYHLNDIMADVDEVVSNEPTINEKILAESIKYCANNKTKI